MKTLNKNANKYIRTTLIILFLLSSCNSAKKNFNNGNYDIAINKAVKKITKNKDDQKNIEILNKSYKIANSKDYDRINFLRSSGMPDIWDEIFTIYNRLKLRQEKVKYLPIEVLEKINFQNINYDNEIHNARRNAADYYYAIGLKKLNEQNRISSRDAYYNFNKVKSFIPNYKDIDSLLIESENQGSVNILYQVINSTELIMPEKFLADLTEISFVDLNILFRRFYNYNNDNTNFHYYIQLNINDIIISPEQVKEIQYTDKKEIIDGYVYQLDAKGNVMKDSLGNDIKIPKYLEISCDISEVSQFKSVLVNSKIIIKDELHHNIIQEPLSAEWVFDNKFITYRGNKEAMSKETMKKINWKFMPFPTNENMILETTDLLKKMSKDFVYKNINLFQ